MPIIFDLPNEWVAFLVFFGIIMVFIAIAEVARKLFKLSPELSRKFVHVMVGVLVSLAPFFLRTSLPVIVLGLIFTIINYITLTKDSLKGMHTTERVSYGTVYFPIAFTLLVLMFWERNLTIFIVSMLVLAFSDTVATIIGERVDSSKKFILWHDQKSLAGSSSFFISAVIVIFFAYPIYSNLAGLAALPIQHLIGMSIFAAFLASIAEAVSKRGSDNLTLTLVAGISIDLYLTNLASGTLAVLGGWFAFSILLGYGAYRLKSLSVSGGYGAFLLGVFLFGMGGWDTMIPLMGFFVLSSILSKIADRKSQAEIISNKGSRRDIVQVYANGGIPLIFALAWYLSDYSSPWLYWAFLASLASATADTWETEIGSFSKGLPVNILTWKRVARGYSGGISFLGTLGGLIGAMVITIIAVIYGSLDYSIELLWMVILAGFAGSIVDSILGASIQAKFKCAECNKATERLVHCDKETQHVSGYQWFDNDWVNVAGSFAGGAIFLLTYYLYY